MVNSMISFADSVEDSRDASESMHESPSSDGDTGSDATTEEDKQVSWWGASRRPNRLQKIDPGTNFQMLNVLLMVENFNSKSTASVD